MGSKLLKEEFKPEAVKRVAGMVVLSQSSRWVVERVEA